MITFTDANKKYFSSIARWIVDSKPVYNQILVFGELTEEIPVTPHEIDFNSRELSGKTATVAGHLWETWPLPRKAGVSIRLERGPKLQRERALIRLVREAQQSYSCLHYGTTPSTAVENCEAKLSFPFQTGTEHFGNDYVVTYLKKALEKLLTPELQKPYPALISSPMNPEWSGQCILNPFYYGPNIRFPHRIIVEGYATPYDRGAGVYTFDQEKNKWFLSGIVAGTEVHEENIKTMSSCFRHVHTNAIVSMEHIIKRFTKLTAFKEKSALVTVEQALIEATPIAQPTYKKIITRRSSARRSPEDSESRLIKTKLTNTMWIGSFFKTDTQRNETYPEFITFHFMENNNCNCSISLTLCSTILGDHCSKGSWKLKRCSDSRNSPRLREIHITLKSNNNKEFSYILLVKLEGDQIKIEESDNSPNLLYVNNQVQQASASHPCKPRKRVTIFKKIESGKDIFRLFPPQETHRYSPWLKTDFPLSAPRNVRDFVEKVKNKEDGSQEEYRVFGPKQPSIDQLVGKQWKAWELNRIEFIDRDNVRYTRCVDGILTSDLFKPAIKTVYRLDDVELKNPYYHLVLHPKNNLEKCQITLTIFQSGEKIGLLGFGSYMWNATLGEYTIEERDKPWLYLEYQ